MTGSAFKDICSNPSYMELLFEERFGMVVDAQWTNRKNNQIAHLFKKAPFKFSNASIEDIEYHTDRKLKKLLLKNTDICVCDVCIRLCFNDESSFY